MGPYIPACVKTLAGKQDEDSQRSGWTTSSSTCTKPVSVKFPKSSMAMLHTHRVVVLHKRGVWPIEIRKNFTTAYKPQLHPTAHYSAISEIRHRLMQVLQTASRYSFPET